jgi:hypothetical protein
MTWRDTGAHSNHTGLLNEAQDLVNAELKERFEKGEIKSPYEIFYETTWLDVIQIFDYTLPYWNDVAINQELRDLISLIDVHNVSKAVATEALRLISAYIIRTETLHYWNYQSNGVQLKRLLAKFYGLNKPLNYDYLRYVLNSDITCKEELISSAV